MNKEQQAMVVYEVPKVKVIEVEVEQGYAVSPGVEGDSDDIYIQ